MNKIIKISVLGLFLSVTACGGGGGSGEGSFDPASVKVHGSCEQPMAGTCVEFVGNGWTIAGAEPRCGMGLADPEPCSSENLIGRCNFMDMPLDADYRTYYYSGSAWQQDDVETLRDQCVNTLKGTFDAF